MIAAGVSAAQHCCMEIKDPRTWPDFPGESSALNTWPGLQENPVTVKVSSSPLSLFSAKDDPVLLERLLDGFVPSQVPPHLGLALGSSRKPLDLNWAMWAETRWPDMIKLRQEGLAPE